MAASIPAMRVLFKEFKSSSRRYYFGSGGSGGEPRSKMQKELGSHSAVVSSHQAEMKDDDSDRGILGSSTSKIYRVDEVDVEYASATKPEAYEMHSKQ
jgi:hypothetical protein